jgi:hypothetical protein
MNEKQQKCYRMLCDLVGGPHHITGKVKESSPWGIQTTISTDFASYDFAELTKLVVLAHDRGIRASLSPLNMQYMRLMLHVRQYRDGPTFYERHPTLEKQAAAIRVLYSTDDNMPEDLAAPESDAAGGGK